MRFARRNGCKNAMPFSERFKGSNLLIDIRRGNRTGGAQYEHRIRVDERVAYGVAEVTRSREVVTIPKASSELSGDGAKGSVLANQPRRHAIALKLSMQPAREGFVSM